MSQERRSNCRRSRPLFSKAYLDEVLVVVQLEAALEQTEFEVARGGQQAARTPLHQRRERLREGRPDRTEQVVRAGNGGQNKVMAVSSWHGATAAVAFQGPGHDGPAVLQRAAHGSCMERSA